MQLLRLRGSKIYSWLSLFTSFGTLLCCALPSLFIVLGMGVTLVSFLGAFPQLIWLSERKEWLFGGSFIMLTITFLLKKYSQTQVCPIDQKDNCETTKSWSDKVFWAAVIINLFGVIFTFILPKLLYGME